MCLVQFDFSCKDDLYQLYSDMPELPEVETTKRGIAPHVRDKKIQRVDVRQTQLRWPINVDLDRTLSGKILKNISRRAKYLLLEFENGYVLIHLGMSGCLCFVNPEFVQIKHAHVDFVFEDNLILRFIDPRRFGAVLWLGDNPRTHSLICRLGPEPFSSEFNGEYLFDISRGKTRSVKSMIMDQHVVTGVGNIYATEVLFLAGIHPTKAAGDLDLEACNRLCQQVQIVLQQAIAKGGTTLRDFAKADGKPGYFQQQLFVYGRKNLPCIRCKQILEEVKVNNRSSVYCRVCQPLDAIYTP